MWEDNDPAKTCPVEGCDGKRYDKDVCHLFGSCFIVVSLYHVQGHPHEEVYHFPLKKRLEALISCHAYADALGYEARRPRNDHFVSGNDTKTGGVCHVSATTFAMLLSATTFVMLSPLDVSDPFVSQMSLIASNGQRTWDLGSDLIHIIRIQQSSCFSARTASLSLTTWSDIIIMVSTYMLIVDCFISRALVLHARVPNLCNPR